MVPRDKRTRLQSTEKQRHVHTLELSRVQTGKFLAQVSVASFLRQKTCRCERGFWRHFSGTRNWRQKLARIEHVLFQVSFCRETPPLIGRSTGNRIFPKDNIITTLLNRKLA